MVWVERKEISKVAPYPPEHYQIGDIFYQIGDILVILIHKTINQVLLNRFVMNSLGVS